MSQGSEQGTVCSEALWYSVPTQGAGRWLYFLPFVCPHLNYDEADLVAFTDFMLRVQHRARLVIRLEQPRFWWTTEGSIFWLHCRSDHHSNVFLVRVGCQRGRHVIRYNAIKSYCYHHEYHLNFRLPNHSSFWCHRFFFFT